jgi:hypothetical protein
MSVIPDSGGFHLSTIMVDGVLTATWTHEKTIGGKTVILACETKVVASEAEARRWEAEMTGKALRV